MANWTKKDFQENLAAQMCAEGWETIIEWVNDTPQYVRLNDQGYRDSNLMGGKLYLTQREICNALDNAYSY